VLKKAVVGPLVDRVDTVFHMAAAVGVKLIVTNPTRTIETNIRGSEVVLQAAAKKGKLVVMASTSEVYGKSAKVPYSEEDDLLLGATTKSRWGYACSKAIDEYLALAYVRERELPIVIVRFFNTVGPRQTGRYGMVLPSFVRQALANEPITVYGTGRQLRCFGYVSEVVEAVLRLIDTPAAIGKVFNIGCDREISINDLAQLVRERAGSSSEIVHIPYEEVYDEGFEDLQRRVPDVRKLQACIGYRPTMEIGEIVDQVIQATRASGSVSPIGAKLGG
jgi:UDP-glucose 4-epimerase